MIMKKYNEKGQATIELITILLALTSCMLGVLFVGAIVVSNNERLLKSKFEAEQRSRQGDYTEFEMRPEYKSWQNHPRIQSYLRSVFKPSNDLHLPFTLDYYSRESDENSLQDIALKVTSPADSKNPSYYYWEETSDYNTRFSATLLKNSVTDNAFNAAQLIGSQNTSGDATTSKFLRGSDPSSYGKVERSMRNTGRKWLNIEVKDSDIRNNPSNHVFMPLIKEDKNIME